MSLQGKGKEGKMSPSIGPVANRLKTHEGIEKFGRVICPECGLPMWQGKGTCKCRGEQVEESDTPMRNEDRKEQDKPMKES